MYVLSTVLDVSMLVHVERSTLLVRPNNLLLVTKTSVVWMFCCYAISYLYFDIFRIQVIILYDKFPKSQFKTKGHIYFYFYSYCQLVRDIYLAAQLRCCLEHPIPCQSACTEFKFCSWSQLPDNVPLGKQQVSARFLGRWHSFERLRCGSGFLASNRPSPSCDRHLESE